MNMKTSELPEDSQELRPKHVKVITNKNIVQQVDVKYKHKHIYLCIYVCVYIYICTHTHTHTYVYTIM